MKSSNIDCSNLFLSSSEGKEMLKDMIFMKADRLEEIKEGRESFLKSGLYPNIQGEIRPYFMQKVFDELREGKEVQGIERDLSNMCYALRKSQNRIPKATEWQRKYEYATKQARIEEVIIKILGVRNIQRNIKCPFHKDNTPSLKVYTKNNRFYCFACGIRGSPIDFVMHYRDCDFKSAVEYLFNC